MKEKAYKVLAIQEKISNAKAKQLIDDGLVSYAGKQLEVARAVISTNAKLVVAKQDVKTIFEDDNLIAFNKPYGLNSDFFTDKKYKLLNRLDKQTSGVILACKNEEFRKKAINEYKNHKVLKVYIAVVKGIISEEIIINEPILSIKTENGAFSKISPKGDEAITYVRPLLISGKKTLVEVKIITGKTHQIRLHLAHIGHGVVGDSKYEGNNSKRMFLHAYYNGIFDYKIIAKPDKSFYSDFGEFENLITYTKSI